MVISAYNNNYNTYHKSDYNHNYMTPCYDHNKLICYSPVAQIILSFFIGVLFSPWSYGFLFLMISIVVVELWWVWIHGWGYGYHLERPLVIILALLGWLVGRKAAGLPIHESGHGKMKEWWYKIKNWNNKKES